MILNCPPSAIVIIEKKTNLSITTCKKAHDMDEENNERVYLISIINKYQVKLLTKHISNTWVANPRKGKY